MWLARLDLLAFGRFTNVQLELGPGFHLIYGPNEAGKSTTLRAIRQLLFGFDERTDDNFVHQNPQLRLGGVVRNHLGESLEIIRRKSRKDSLRASDDTTVIDEQRWHDLLCGIDEATFSNRYGIDYERLVEGGHEIATGSGDLGEILFATGSGVMDLADVQKRLQEEASELFKPQGKKQKINQAIVEWQQQRDLVAAKLLPVSEWEEADRSRRQTREALDALTKELDQTLAEADRHRRLQKAIPLLGERQIAQALLASLAECPVLSSDFGTRRQESLVLLKHADDQLHAEQTALAEIQLQLERLAEPGALTTRTDELTQLLTGWGSYHKAQIDRPQLVDQLQKVNVSIGELQLTLSRSTDLVVTDLVVPDRNHRTRIGQLGRQKAGILHALEHAQKRREQLDLDGTRVRAELATLPMIQPLDELRTAVRGIRIDGDLDQQLLRIQHELTEICAEGDVLLKGLEPWAGTPAALLKMTVPDSRQLAAWDAELRSIESAKAVLLGRQSDLTAEMTKLKQQIEVLKRDFQVPTEADLQTIRQNRDRTGDTLRTTLKTDHAKAESVLDRFQQQIVESDHLADRLRNEADRVAQLAEHTSDLIAVNTRDRDVATQLAALETRRIEFEEKWIAAWPELGFDPKAPREMQTWISRREVWLKSYELHLRRVAEENQIKQRLGEHHALLVRLLADGAPGSDDRGTKASSNADAAQRLKRMALEKQQRLIWTEPQDVELNADMSEEPNRVVEQMSLSELLLQADEHLRQAEQIQKSRTEAEAFLSRHTIESVAAEDQLRFCTTQLEEWQRAWQNALTELKLPPDSSPDTIAVVLDSMSELADLRRQAEQLEQRIQGIDADANAFSASVIALCREVAPDLAEQATPDAVKTLRARTLAAQKEQATINQLTARQTQAERLREAALESRARSVQMVGDLCRAAGKPVPPSDASSECLVQTLDELATIESNSRRQQACEQDVAKIETRLRELAVGMPLDEFIAAVSQSSAQGLANELKRLDEVCDRLSVQRDQLNQQLGGFELRLQQMDGSTDAAEAEEKQRQWLARIESDAGQYIRLKLASTVLRAAIERYREKIRGPVLSVASELFQELTLGSFEGLRVVEDDAGHSILVGLRSGQREMVTVGGMSEGTCDQLYLALRLASLSLESAPRNHLPFIADDILIQFDDARSAATLRILARLAKDRQVIFFTHHEHLIDIATKLSPSDFTIHRLDR